MDIHTINKGLDKFMRRVYGVDVYLTESNHNIMGKYKIHILVFPSKFLKSSPEFDEKYYNFFNREEREILNDIFKSFRYLGIDRNEIQGNYLYFEISSDLPDYLKKYNEELISNINNFINDSKLSEYILNVRINRIEPSIPHGSSYHVPYMDLRLSYDTINKNMDVYDYLNDSSFREPLMDYISTKMEVDPQIEFWFE